MDIKNKREEIIEWLAELLASKEGYNYEYLAEKPNSYEIYQDDFRERADSILKGLSERGVGIKTLKQKVGDMEVYLFESLLEEK